jgi:hypothetical protein
MGIPSRRHPAFGGRTIPADAALGPCRLTLLGVDVVEEDYAVVMESAAELEGFFGDAWPRGLTLEENRIDLAWHQREFEHGRSFAWVVRDPARGLAPGRYIGCAYVFPPFAERAPMAVFWWLRTGEAAHAPAFGVAFAAWLAGPPWPDLPAEIHARPDPGA